MRTTTARTLTAVAGALALAAISALVVQAVPVTLPPLTLGAKNVNVGWGGIEEVGQSPVQSIRASITLPDASAYSVSHALDPMMKSAWWVGLGGDGTLVPAENDWLPQTGYYLQPMSRVWWVVKPFAVMTYESGNRAELPGWIDRFPFLVPAGAVLSARLSERGGHLVAYLHVSFPPAYRSLAKYIRANMTYTLPVVRGEPRHYTLAEAILETPNNSPATPQMTALSPDYLWLPSFAHSAPITVTVRYAQPSSVTVHLADLDGGARGSVQPVLDALSRSALTVQATVGLDTFNP